MVSRLEGRQKAVYFMETYESMIDGSFRGGAFHREIIPGDAEHSPLVEYIEGRKKPKMPYDRKPLNADEIKSIRAWIDQGAQADSETAMEHLLEIEKIPLTTEQNSFWMSCRAPRNEQNLSLRVKIIDEATRKVVVYDWPKDDFVGGDFNGRWSQWKITVPEKSMKFPGTVKVVLCVAPFMSGREAEDSLDGVIFLLDKKQTPETELLQQKDFKSVPEPEPPPHKKVIFNYVLRVHSDVDLAVYPERESKLKFQLAEKDVPANTVATAVWDLSQDPSVQNGWYVGRLKCDSRNSREFQPDMAILFKIQAKHKP